MLFKDIDIFLSAARAILQGIDPYSLPNTEVFYPLPFYFLFVPLAALPLPVVHTLWTALQAVVLVVLLRKRALAVTLSTLVLLSFIFGQVDIVFLAFFVLLRAGIAGGVALAFLVLKPQLVLLLAPWQLWQWWRHDRRQLALFLGLISAILILSFIVQPDWVVRLLARSGERMRAYKSASLWGLLSFLPGPLWLGSSALIALALVVWVWRRSEFDLVTTVGLFLSPFIFSYNLMPLCLFVRDSRLLWALTALSWIAFWIAAQESNDRASALVAVAVLIVLYSDGRKRMAAKFGVAPAKPV
jgi:Glycosyltransferase family 87